MAKKKRKWKSEAEMRRELFEHCAHVEAEKARLRAIEEAKRYMKIAYPLDPRRVKFYLALQATIEHLTADELDRIEPILLGRIGQQALTKLVAARR